MKREVIETADGSKTIYIPEMSENYHSNHGALQEAQHVFIKNGLHVFAEKKEVYVFEMGFGTGLNAMLSMVEADRTKQKVYYTGIEAYPLEMEIIQQIDYEKLVDDKFNKYFKEMHLSNWAQKHTISDTFSFEKIHEKIQDYTVLEDTMDLVYFDAFGPRAQEEMWGISILEKMYKILKSGGVFVTYCAKGQVKRDLKSLGFIVENLEGPPGKREMTRAIKPRHIS
jgi:tRNA U34 5-methylaminomethyl-2-thiouridine-forming methyltransferase MnmC